MKKVLFTATVDSHIKHFHLPYLQWFQERGYEVHVATNGKEEIPYCDVKHQISFERNPIKINNLKAIKSLKNIINHEKFDIIHCHTPMGGVVTRLAAMKAREEYHVKVIYTAHGFHFFKGAPFINWIIYYPIERILAKVTDCLITINEEDYQLAKKKFKAKQVELVHGTGVDKSKFNFTMPEEEKLELRKKLGLKKDDFVIIYVAEMNENKNQGMLIKAMKQLEGHTTKNIKLLLVGQDCFHGKYQQLVAELGLQDKVYFLGYRTNVNRLLKISNLYVSTSQREGLPLNIIEASYIGLPIIATDCRGNRDLVKNQANGHIVAMNDVDSLALKIQEVIKNYPTNHARLNDIYELKQVRKEMERIYINRGEKVSEKVY